MRMALNELQYMSLSMSVIKYDDIRKRLQSSAKDEDISPFTAVDKYALELNFTYTSVFLSLCGIKSRSASNLVLKVIDKKVDFEFVA